MSRPRHAPSRLTTFRHRAQDWLDRTVNFPKPQIIGTALTSANVGELVTISIEEATPVWYGKLKIIKNRDTPKPRPFDWKLDAPEVVEWCQNVGCIMEGQHIAGGTSCIDAEGFTFA